MRALIIYDESARSDRVADRLMGVHHIDLLPFAENWKFIQEFEIAIAARRKVAVSTLDASALVNVEVERIRKRVTRWSSDLGDLRIRDKTVKEWLLYRDGNVSGYWFTILSEKNPLKTNLFLILAQSESVARLTSSGKYDLLVLAVRSKYLKKACREVGRESKTRILNVRLSRRKAPVSFSIRENHGFLKFFRAVAILLRTCWWGFQARRALGHIARGKSSNEGVLFVTYYPYIDRVAAGRGVFRNTYAEPLQEKLGELGIPILWILMFVFVNGSSYRGAVLKAQRLAEAGEQLYVVEEFITLRVVVLALREWLSQILRYLWISKSLRRSERFRSFGSRGTLPIIDEILKQSFLAPPSLQGALYYHGFENVLAQIGAPRWCLYFCEMQIWEKALNAAIRSSRSAISTIGFQHSSLSVNYFHFFHTIEETDRTGLATEMPLPTVLAANGEIPASLLSRSGYGGLVSVEAVRQIYLADVLSTPITPPTGQPVLLVVGSYDVTETRLILSLLVEAFPVAEGIEIWLKGHPSCDIEMVCRQIGLDSARAGYRVQEGHIAVHLEKAWAVLVGTSTVAIEALAFGCEVLVPLSSAVLSLAPILSFSDMYRSVTTPEELRQAVLGLTWSDLQASVIEKRSFVQKYWNLDPAMTRWSDLFRPRGAPAERRIERDVGEVN